MTNLPLKSHLKLATTEAEHIIKRLSNHWQHKMTITEANGITLIPFSETNQAWLSFDNGHLFVKLVTDTNENQSKLQGVILNHLNRMANTEFVGEWQAD